MTVTILIESLSPDERVAHATQLVERICKRISQLPPDELAISCDFLEHVFDELDEAAQISLANSLAHAPAAPVPLIADLANRRKAISVPILRWSPVIDDQALLDVIIRAGGERLLAIAERDRLSEPVTQAVIEHADSSVIIALARNPAARFNNAGLRTLSWKTIGNPGLEEALCVRDDLPQDFHRKLMRGVMMRTNIRFATKSNEFDANTIRLMLRTLEAPTNIETAEALEPTDEAADEIDWFAASSKLTESELIRIIGAGQIEEIARALALMAKLDRALTRRILISENNDTLAIVARSIEISVETYRRLLALVRKCDAADAALDYDVADYETVPSLIARAAVTLHRRRRVAAVKRQIESSRSDGLAPARA